MERPARRVIKPSLISAGQIRAASSSLLWGRTEWVCSPRAALAHSFTCRRTCWALSCDAKWSRLFSGTRPSPLRQRSRDADSRTESVFWCELKCRDPFVCPRHTNTHAKRARRRRHPRLLLVFGCFFFLSTVHKRANFVAVYKWELCLQCTKCMYELIRGWKMTRYAHCSTSTGSWYQLDIILVFYLSYLSIIFHRLQ